MNRAAKTKQPKQQKATKVAKQPKKVVKAPKRQMSATGMLFIPKGIVIGSLIV